MKNKIMSATAVFIMITLILFGCQNDYNDEEITHNDTITFTYDFEDSMDGWMGGLSGIASETLADASINNASQGNDTLYNQPYEGIYLTCSSDKQNLFPYTTKKLSLDDGLSPLTSYRVNMTFDISYSPNRSNTIPINEIVINAGIVNVQPEVELIQRGDNNCFFIKPNNEFDNPSTKLISLGKIDVRDKQDNSKKTTKTFEQTFNAFTNSNGDLWIIIGIESDSKGTSSLLLDNINIYIEKGNATFS